MATQVTQPLEPEVPKTNEPEKDEATGKFVYTYQPRDKEGQFIGKPYKFLYTDHQDLVKQLTDAKENGDRYIYEVKSGKRQVNGEPAVPLPSFQPAPESAEEADRKRREEFRRTAQEEFGAPLEDVRESLKRARLLEEGMKAQRWAMENEANGYYICPENGKKMVEWLDERKLAHIPSNYDLAFEELREKLIPRPQEQPVIPADSTQQQPTRAEVKPQSTGVIPGQFAGTRLPNSQVRQPLTTKRFREIDLMSLDQFRQLQRNNPKEADSFLGMKHGPAQPQQ